MRSPLRRLATPLAVLCVGASFQARAVQPPSPSAATPPDRAPNWVKVAEDAQRLFYLDEDPGSSTGRRAGKADLRSLMQFKVPQVLQGTQIWSIVSSLQLDCDHDQALTLSDTVYSGKMGTGRAVSFRASSDTWHAPAPGSLGEMAWDAACGKA